MKKIILVLLAILFITSCASGKWYKTDATTQDFNLDKHQCSIEAQQVGGVWAFHEGIIWRNKRLRANFNSCMISKGWEWVKE